MVSQKYRKSAWRIGVLGGECSAGGEEVRGSAGDISDVSDGLACEGWSETVCGQLAVLDTGTMLESSGPRPRY